MLNNKKNDVAVLRHDCFAVTGKSVMETNILRNKTVVITGASSGAGRATAVEFAQYGTNLVIAGRNEPALEEVAQQCRTLGSEVLVVVTDVTDAAAVQELARQAVDWKGSLYAWVNNAGVLAAGEFDKTPIEVSTKVVSTNLVGYMNGAHAALPVFKKQGFGIIVNNISIGGFYPVPYGAGYTASKFGLRGFSEALREELTQWPGIKVCDMFSGFLNTPGIEHASNFTGKKLHPGPILADARTLAKQIVKATIYPRSCIFVGITPRLLKAGHSLLPKASNRLTGRIMRKYFQSAPDMPPTDGNVMRTVDFNMNTRGHYEPVGKRTAQKILKTGGTLIAGLLAGYFAASYIKARR
ncbi:MAG: SDR family oxidoreductase [Agriterribacter sp.]